MEQIYRTPRKDRLGTRRIFGVITARERVMSRKLAGNFHSKKITCWKLQSRTPQAHMIVKSPQGDMPGVQQWTPRGQQWTQNCTNPPYVPADNLNSQPHMHSQPHRHSQPQGLKNLQQQVQHLMTNPASSGSVIGSTSLANSSKKSILSVLSSLSTL